MTPGRPLAITHPLRAFFVTWLGQLLSLLGSRLSSFALGLAVYQESGSITQFALYSSLVLLPNLLLSPFAGALADRWDRRRVMLLSDVGAGVSSLIVFLLVTGNDAAVWREHPWLLYPPVILGAAFTTLRWPAYYAACTLLVPRRHLGRANALIDLAVGVAQVAAPVLAVALLARIGLGGILLIDLLSFLLSTGALLLVRFPAPSRHEEAPAGRGSLWEEMGLGWKFIRDRPGLMGLTAFTGVFNFVISMVPTLITPLVLSFTDVTTLGVIQTTAGVGMLVGAIVASVWSGPRHLVASVLCAHLLSGLALLLGCLRPSVPLIAAAASVFLFSVPPIQSRAWAIWQLKVTPELQGRVFAVRRMVTLAASPVASLLAGWLADRVFEPWLAVGGALAGTVGKLLGTGPGRGIAFLMGMLGVACVGNVLAAWFNPRVRYLEDELHDTVAEPLPLARPAAGASET